MVSIQLPSGVYSYDPQRQLGKAGSFGAVFMGLTSGGAEVAIKRLHLSAADASHREMEIAEKLRGKRFQQVMEVIDSGADVGGGGYFVVMPRAEYSLRDELVRRGKFDPHECASVLLQVVLGLGEVSAIVHRDLKPENLLWHDGRWKIADFGIARFVEDATSSKTLKGCLTPNYAAPEQWRLERAVSATDIYAAGCIGFELLTGAPPFTADPEKEHQTAPFPPFDCADPRLKGLLPMMSQKPIPARSTRARVQAVLEGIMALPSPRPAGALADLAAAGAAVAVMQHSEEAKRLALAREEGQRIDLYKAGNEMLTENIRRLWEKIHLAVPASSFRHNPGPQFRAHIFLGRAALEVGRISSGVIPQNEFSQSHWDVVGASTITVANGSPPSVSPYQWEVALWYVKQPGLTDYRWVEVGYFQRTGRASAPLSSDGFRNADFAAAQIQSVYVHAFGPWPIDGENEDEFHERYLWLFTRAARGQLRQPSHMPIGQWPPAM